jgi:hypothetical protein
MWDVHQHHKNELTSKKRVSSPAKIVTLPSRIWKKTAKNGELTSQSAGLSSKTGELMTSKNLDFISKEW